MMIGLVIWSMVAVTLAIIGFCCRDKKEAVGFFTFAEPPKIRDIPAYNHAMCRLWLIAAVIFEAIGVLTLVPQNDALVLIMVPVVMAWVIGLMVAYYRIEQKYREK